MTTDQRHEQPVQGAEPTGTDPAPVVPPPGRPVDRPAALAAGAPGIPRKFWYWTLGVALVLALGGLLAEHVFSAAGLNPVASPTTTTTTLVRPGPGASVGSGGGSPSLNSSLTSFMGLSTLSPSPAPAITLTEQTGAPFSLSSLRGQAVVLTFFDGRCNDICPVLAAELKAADADLGADAAHVSFVTVNTDPRDLVVSGLTPAAAGTGLAAEKNWYMVTGTLSALNSVWRSYGVTINYQPSSGVVAHNDLMYFVDPQGNLRFRATPFADESSTGQYSLTQAAIARWGQGIASYAERAYSAAPPPPSSVSGNS